jgi:hypothetical protein
MAKKRKQNHQKKNIFVAPRTTRSTSETSTKKDKKVRVVVFRGGVDLYFENADIPFQKFKNLIEANNYLYQHRYKIYSVENIRIIKKEKFKTDDNPLSCDISGQIERYEKRREQPKINFWKTRFDFPEERDKEMGAIVLKALKFLESIGENRKSCVNAFCAFVLAKKPKSDYRIKLLFDELFEYK